MRRSSLRLYGPFLAIALVQALFIVAAPSESPDRSVSAGSFGAPLAGDGSDGFTTGGGGTVSNTPVAGGSDPLNPVGSAGTPVAGGVATPVASGGGGSSSGGGTAATTPAGQTPAPSGGGNTQTTAAPVATAGDTSHCVGDLQFDILLDNPPCRAKWVDGADNGGATYQGVTADSVKVVFFEGEANAAVNAVLAPGGLAATEEEMNIFYENFEIFFNKHYETYGRKVEMIRFQGSCPTSPPNVPTCKEAAREVIKMQPFLVIWGTTLYGEVFDEFARSGIVSVGGWHFDNSFFTQRRPFRYDIFMDGTRSMQLTGEYYCKKMAGGMATHAGLQIHQSFPANGQRDLNPRRVGIISPEIEANTRTAETLKSIIEGCGDYAVIVKYESNIERAQEQTEATTQKLIAEQITTVIHIGDPVAPAIATAGFTSQNYFPEYMIAGVQLLDYDVLGRLYDKQQMAHAFGLGHLAEPVSFNESNVARMYRDVGRGDEPCKSCNLPMGYASMMASMIHGPGPNLNPLTLEQYLLNSAPYGGDRVGTQRIEFGPDDYTGISDAREIYWSESAISKIDGQPGAYVSPNNAARYQLGQVPGGGLSDIPVPPR